MDLQRLVAHAEADVRRQPLGHRAVHLRVGRLRIQLGRSQPHHLPCGDQLGGHVGELELQRLHVRQRPPELAPLVHVALRRGQRALRRAHRAGCDIDAAAVQPLHRDAKALPFLPEQLRRRHAHPIEGDRSRGLAVPAHLVLLAAVLDARGIGLDEEGGDAIRARPAGARHHDQHVGRARAGDEGLAAIEHIRIAIAPRRRAQRCRIRSRARLGEAVGRQLAPCAERRPPLRGDLGPRERRHHPRRHVMDAQKRRRRRAGRSQLLKHQGRVQPRQSKPARRLIRIKPAEAQLARMPQRVARKDPARVPRRRMRRHLVAREVPRRLLESALLLVQLEVHGRLRLTSS